MEYQWVGMDKVPPSASMIPLEREAYIDDMNLTGAKLSRQVEVDTPRARIYICDDTSDMLVRIKNGAFLEEFLRKTLP